MLVLLAYIAGFLVAAVPVGPLTLLFYRHAMVEQWRSAIALGGVAALSDVLYTALAVLGYAWLIASYPEVVLGLRLFGVLLVGAMGVRYALFPPEVARTGTDRIRGVAAQGLLIALVNPSALLTWLVAIDLLRTTFELPPLGPMQRLLVPLAVGAGAATWFWGLAAAWRSSGKAPPPGIARAFVRVVGVVLILTALGYAVQTARPDGFGA